MKEKYNCDQCRKKDIFSLKVSNTRFFPVKVSKCFIAREKSLFYCIALKKKYDEVEADLKQLPTNQFRNKVSRLKKKVSTTIEEEYVSKFPEFDPNILSDLHEIEKSLRCRIYLWGRRSQFGKYECFRKSPFMPKSTYDNFVDVLLTESEIELSLINCGLILDIDETISENLRDKRQNFTLFEALAIAKRPEIKNKIALLRSYVESLEQEWGKSDFHIEDATNFYRKFKMNVQIWSINSTGPRSIIREKVFDRRGMPKLVGEF